MSPAAEPAPARPHAARVVRRLFATAGTRMWSFYGTLLAIVGESAVETGVIPVLLALMFLAIAPSVADLKHAAPGMARQVDWIQKLGWVHADTPAAQLRSLLIFAVAMLAAWCAKALFGFARIYLSQHFALGVIRELRREVYDHLLRQSISFYRARTTGDLTSRVSNDVAVLQRLLGTDLVDAARGPVVAALALTLMFSLEWRLTLLALVCVPVISFVIARSSDRLRVLSREVQTRLGRLNAFLQERIAGVETVQIFGMESHEAETFREINNANYRANLRVAATTSVLMPLVELISSLGMVVLLVVAGYLTIKGPLSLATLIAFAYAGQNLGSRLSLLGKIWLSTQQAAAAGDRIFEVLDAHEEVPEITGAPPLPRVRGEICFHQVLFHYRDHEPVLRGIDITIPPGQVVAVVGASGAGKTSLVNLIPRFYEPTAGHITIDGVDTRTISVRSLRSQIGVVPQEPILFSGSIAENIAYGQPEASPEQIRAAARAAHAEDFIEALARGYDTPVGERAAHLSGGQRQRIAIARTLLCDPRVLILDEATSALDAESEHLVQTALDYLMQGRTTLVIAHRLSTIQRADRILVLAGGRVAEEGSHAELMRAGGAYRRLYESQLLAAGQEAPASP